MSFEEAVIVPLSLYEKYFPKEKINSANSEITTVSRCTPTKKNLKTQLNNRISNKPKTSGKKRVLEWINFEDRKKK